MTRPTHGGDVDAVAREYGVAAAELLDFSASINPLGPPPSLMARLQREASDTALLARYPDSGYAELRSTLAASVKVPQECIAIANGSAGVMRAAIDSLRPARCLCPTPAFSEQVQALDVAGCAIERFPLRAADGFRLDADALCLAITAGRPELCLLTNPHNPSGSLASAADMSRIVSAAAAVRSRVLVDEAFIDFAPQDTLTADAATSHHLIVVRSLTKFYGMPALRVGYAVSAPARAAQIEAHVPAWPVTTLAASAAVEAVKDEPYACETLRAVAVDRQHLRDCLIAIGLETYASAGNFLLLRLRNGMPDSKTVRSALIRRHRIIVRDCCSFDGMEDGRFIRVAVRSRADNERLIDAIDAVLQQDR